MKKASYSLMKTATFLLSISLACLVLTVQAQTKTAVSALPIATNAAADDAVLINQRVGASYVTKTVAVSNLVNSVKTAGALGNGVADDTTPVQNQLNQGRAWFPKGTYVVANLTLTKDTVIDGEGGVVLLRKTGTTGTLLDAGTFTLTMRNVDVYGGGNGTTNENHNGIRLWAVGTPELLNVGVRGFNGQAVLVTGDMNINARSNHWYCHGLKLQSNNAGIKIATASAAEYGRLIGSEISRNPGTGLELLSANNTILGNQINDNGAGIICNPANGRTHSTVVGNTINHNTLSILVSNALTGISIKGNNILGAGPIYIKDSRHVQFDDNTCEVSPVFEISGSGTNYFRGNTFHPTGISFVGFTNVLTLGNATNGVALNIGTPLVASNTNAVTLSGTKGVAVVTGSGALMGTNHLAVTDGIYGFSTFQTNDSKSALSYYQTSYPGVHNAWQIGARQTVWGGEFVFQNYPEGGAGWSQVLTLRTNGHVEASKLTATNGYFFPTNALSAWPAAPRTRGEAYVGNSNGVLYVLTSGPGALSWSATNKLAP